MLGQLHADTAQAREMMISMEQSMDKGKKHAPGSVAMRASAAAWPANSRVTAAKRMVLKLTSMARERLRVAEKVFFDAGEATLTSDLLYTPGLGLAAAMGSARLASR